MGSDDGDANERPVHRVELRRPFYFATYETTQKQYETVLGVNPSGFRGQDLPVEMVAWEDAVKFCEELSRRDSQRYRLPTEAEWEYACRAGTTTPYANGADRERLVDVGNIVDAEAHKLFPERRALQSSDGYVFTAPVGRFAPNGFGLHDMHGNVWEWCADWHAAPPPLEKGAARAEEIDPQGPAAGRDRVIRGGDWYHDWSFARSAQRFPIYPGLYRRHGGFRVVREIAK